MVPCPWRHTSPTTEQLPGSWQGWTAQAALDCQATLPLMGLSSQAPLIHFRAIRSNLCHSNTMTLVSVQKAEPHSFAQKPEKAFSALPG